MVLFREGKVAAEGAVAEVFIQDTIAHVFDIECRVIEDPLHGHPICLPYPKGQAVERQAG